jgi:hypothetical protein
MANDVQILGPAQSSSAGPCAKDPLPGFQRHEILAAKVLRPLPNGTMLLAIKGRQVAVRTQVRLQPGQSVTLQVKSLSPATILQLMAETGAKTKAGRLPVLLQALTENTWKVALEAIQQSRSGRPALNNLLALIQESSQGIFRNPGSDLLSRLLSKAGFSLESKLKKALWAHTYDKAQSYDKSQLESLLHNDLKALLLKAIGQHSQPQRQLKQLLSVIENFQLLNQEGLQKGGRVLLPIPMQFPDGFFTMGQLLLERGPSEQHNSGTHAPAEPVYTAKLHLTLSRLGTLQAEVKLCAKQVSVNFLVSDSENKEFIDSQLATFMQALADKGFVFKAMGFTVADSEADMEAPISEFMPAETNILCLTA